jgi:peptidoglycan/xylan/chitin deacetylase (PgdA/CDA1 family)
MRLRGLCRIQRLLEAARRRCTSAVAILLYHRVQVLSTDPQLLSVTPAHFLEHLEVLRRSYTPIPLKRAVAALRNKEPLPHHAVVVTFDDGYADNYEIAKPLLAKAAVPATVFVTAGRVGATTEFWWDELERIFLQPGVLPTELSLTIDGQHFHRDLDEWSRYATEDFERHRAWTVLCERDPGPRQTTYRALCQRLKPATNSDRDLAMTTLRTWASSAAPSRESHRALSYAQASQLVEDGLIEVGAHTMAHPVLSTLNRAEQRDEVVVSKSRL